MQLTARAWLVAPLFALASIPEAARADDPKPDGPPESSLEKHASLEVAGYTDSNHVSVLTPSVAGSIGAPSSGAALHGQYLVDVVSAASPDIVSTASRRWTEVRHAGALSADYKPHDFGINVGGSISREPDTLAYALGSNLTYDLDEKNATLLFGLGYGHDTIGRADTPFAVFGRDVQRGSLSAGLSRLLDRSTVLAGTLDFDVENGDSSKPYRYIPMFSPSEASSVANGASVDWVNAHRLPERPLKQLPLRRLRYAFTLRYAHRFDTSTLRLEERLYDDSWALKASTTDGRWVFGLGERWEIWPHARFHAQSAASFWRLAYVSHGNSVMSFDLPEYRTGDRELGPLWTVTGGGGVRMLLGGKVDPHALTFGFHLDAMYTTFENDLYVLSRTGAIGAFILEGAL